MDFFLPKRPTKLGKKGEHGGEEEDEEEDITLLMTSRWIQAALIIDVFLGLAICSYAFLIFGVPKCRPYFLSVK